MSVPIEEVSFRPTNSQLFDKLMGTFEELKNKMIAKLFYSLDLNSIKSVLNRTRQLPKPLIDLTYSLPNIRPQMMKLKYDHKMFKSLEKPIPLGLMFPTIQLPDPSNKKNIGFSQWCNCFGLPKPSEKDQYFRGTGNEMKTKWPICSELNLGTINPYTTNTGESDFGYSVIKEIPWLEYVRPDRYYEKIFKNLKKAMKSNQNFIDDKLIWLWESNKYTDTERNIIIY
jgi:hypothetical protein